MSESLCEKSDKCEHITQIDCTDKGCLVGKSNEFDVCCDGDAVSYSRINKEKYDYALNILSRAKNPRVEFVEDINHMRAEAKMNIEKSVAEALEIFSGLVSGR